MLALAALGVGPGDEVILPTFTFFATVGAVCRLGANPIFADIDPATFNIDPYQVENKITGRTKAIMVVHLFGQCVEMDPFLDMAARHDLPIVEDAAQAIGAEYHGQRTGSMGAIGCFSFYPSKNLGGYGDGGMVVTNDPDLGEIRWPACGATAWSRAITTKSWAGTPGWTLCRLPSYGSSCLTWTPGRKPARRRPSATMR